MWHTQAASLAVLCVCSCFVACDRTPSSTPAETKPQAAFELESLALLQRLDPLPAGDARKVVLAVHGMPIRRGDFDRILDHWLPTLPPDTALVTLRETALLNELLPRALAMHAVGPARLEAIAAVLEQQRGSDGRYDLEALASAIAPYSAAEVDPAEIFEIEIDRKRNAQPLLAAMCTRLLRAGDQVGPIVTRDGVFVLERSATGSQAGPLLPGAIENSQGPLWVRAVSLVWPLPPPHASEGEPLRGLAARQHIEALMSAAVRAKEVEVLDPEYADAVPPWLPTPK